MNSVLVALLLFFGSALAWALPAQVPDVPLVDQDGRAVHLYRDLVRGRVAAFTFVFTDCSTICTPVGAQVAQLQRELGPAARDISLVTVTLNPGADTPAKLKAWAAQFQPAPGWSLLTGEKPVLERLLKELEAFTPDLQAHSPLMLIVDDVTGAWSQVNALETSPREVAALLRRTLAQRPATQPAAEDRVQAGVKPAARYFSDLHLIDQHGREVSFYPDLLAGRTVVINTFFSQCSGVCGITMPLLQRLQKELGPPLQIISITVDPAHDTPATLQEYAETLGTGENWRLLTGDKPAVEFALQKLGLSTETREGHSNVLIVGNDATGLWKKLRGLAAPEEILQSVRSVLEEKP